MATAGPPILCCRMLAARAITDISGKASNGRVPGSFLQRRQWRSFRAALDCLRAECAAAKPVIVRTSWLPPSTLGECFRRSNRFVIRLNWRMDENQAVETLLHEWAHALAWSLSLDSLAGSPHVDQELFEYASHDESWGCAYSRVYRAWACSQRE